MTEIIGILKSTCEYKHFGLNILTIASVATIFFSLLQAYGIIKQGKEIRQKESGESIAPIFFIYNFYYFFIFLIFGLYENSIAMILNGSLSFLYLPIIAGLKKYKGLSKKDFLAALLMFPIIPAMFIYPDRHHLLFFFSALSIVAVLKQFKELLKEKNFGALSLKYIWMFFLTSILWGILFAATDKWLLVVPCAIGTLLYSFVLILEKKFRLEKAYI